MAATIDGKGLEEEKQKIKSLLISSKKLERYSGADHLKQLLSAADRDTFQNVEHMILEMLSDIQMPWEARQGALIGARTVLQVCESSECSSSAAFDIAVKQYAQQLLEDIEYAVRESAGELLGTLCKKIGSSVYSDIRSALLDGIKTHVETPSPACDIQLESQLTDAIDVPASQGGPVVHDPDRWKRQETWMKCLLSVIQSCGTAFNEYIDNELLQLITTCLNNNNRFVRETACLLLSSIVSTSFGAEGEVLVPLESSAVCVHANIMSSFLSVALADTCSQVRMAACVAARRLLTGLPEGDIRQSALIVVLPALCFNRYYAADGVKLYSQETWTSVTRGTGKQLVEENIDSVVDFYISQLNDLNPEVSDTACACIAELSQKMDVSVLGRHVPKLLTNLQCSFSVDCFSTRDAACIACGKLIAAFPAESQSSMDSLYSWLFELLQDNAPPVREAAAIALCNAVSAYGQTSLNQLISKVKVGLESVGKEEPTIEVRVSPDQLTACSTNAQCSMDVGSSLRLHKSHRPAEAWELADGCLCVMCELCRLPLAANDVAKLLPCLATSASHRHYVHHVFFLQSVCKQLPGLFRNLGKRMLKMYLDTFFDVIFYAASCDSVPVREAAVECIDLLSKDLGPNIFRARVESYNSRYLQFVSTP